MSFNLYSLHFAHKADPLDKTSPLQAQESEDSCVSLLLAFLLELLGDIFQIEEPTTLDHQSLNFLRLFLLEASRSIESQGIECLPLQTQVDRVGADLAIKSVLFAPV